MAIKLDLGRAWNEAVALMSANKDVIAVVAGVFFFLPSAISTIAIPMGDIQAAAGSGEIEPEALLDLLAGFYAQYWWVFALVALFQAVGMIGLLALLTDQRRPTVGEALGFGLKALIPYIAAQLLATFLLVAAFLLPIVLGAAINTAVAVLLGVVGVVLAIYIWVKFALVSPVIAIEREMNPLAALRRSWKLTKGNSLRLFAFIALLALCFAVLTLLANMVFSIATVAGEQVGLFVSAIGGAVMNSALVVVFLAVLAAVHRQLSGGTSEAVRDAFE
ncbi:glycerophosphoryl diester phosphodiesterase membrane domain-containing protein [Aurantiacibacter aquimixticola]|nr:glycerophosphoryl diester phosphodiesterase membrane domain-containing protein [Aurantiacibacter aquimixticola]